jgi:nitrogen fixation NifU-like protein
MADPYQDILLDHFRHPRHQIADPERPADCELRNPLCGDLVRLWGHCDDRGVHLQFQAEGCAICNAAASIMCDSVEARSPADTRALLERILAAFADGPAVADSEALAALCDVRNFPMRSRCATLAWSALESVADSAKW